MYQLGPGRKRAFLCADPQHTGHPILRAIIPVKKFPLSDIWQKILLELVHQRRCPSKAVLCGKTFYLPFLEFADRVCRQNTSIQFLTKRPRTGLNISAWICTIILAVLNAVIAASVVKSSLLPNLSIEEAFRAHSFVPKVPFEAERPSSTVF